MRYQKGEGSYRAALPITTGIEAVREFEIPLLNYVNQALIAAMLLL